METRTRLVHSLSPPLAYPGLMVRAAAFLIDFSILLLVDVVFALIIYLFGFIDPADPPRTRLLEVSLWLSARWIYFSVWEASRFRATPGAAACHLTVVDAQDGAQLSFSQSSIRFFAKGVSLLTFGLGWAPIFFHPRRRTLHDVLSGSLVVRFEPPELLRAVLEDRPAEAALVRGAAPSASDAVRRRRRPSEPGPAPAAPEAVPARRAPAPPARRRPRRPPAPAPET